MPPAYDAKRKLRNYLLDARFQLKFTAYIIGISLVLAGMLGAFLVRTTQALMDETGAAVEARSRAAEASRELSNATLTNELLTQLSDPAFEAQLREKSRVIDARFETERTAILAQRAELLRRQRLTWWTLGGCLVAFITFVALATIVTTHKVAGPIFRIKRIVQDISEGRLSTPTHALRRGDELRDLFEATVRMVRQLRTWHEEDAQALARAVEHAERAGLPADVVQELRTAEARLRSRLE